MTSLNHTLSRRIKSLRHQTGMSQEKFADAIGATRRSVMRWEAGTSIPNALYQQKIAEVTGSELIDDASRERQESDDDTEDDLLIALMDRWVQKRGYRLVPQP